MLHLLLETAPAMARAAACGGAACCGTASLRKASTTASNVACWDVGKVCACRGRGEAGHAECACVGCKGGGGPAHTAWLGTAAGSSGEEELHIDCV